MPYTITTNQKLSGEVAKLKQYVEERWRDAHTFGINQIKVVTPSSNAIQWESILI